MRRVTLAGIAAVVLSLLAAAPAGAQAPAPDPAPTAATPGTTYYGVIATRHEVLRYDLEAPATTVLRIRVDHTNRRCEVWATLRDGTAGSVVQNFVPDDGVDIEALVVESGRYEVAIDSGPIRTCTGATFSLSAEFLPVASSRTRSAPTPSPSRCDEICRNVECLYYCQKIATLNTLIRKLHHKISTSGGAARARAIRQLHAMKRARVRARRAQSSTCLG